ncbi:hypothetical protein RJ639_020955 [Escallonia herrerae]|uniref:Uncharacterized protein n=1 Tax=Escallonia herrerae TaxID=1293975 RepID=A0AA88V5Y9_9ASTE|nr:hypothetical protein RJ639_020955 [Escallonia herrerae]
MYKALMACLSLKPSPTIPLSAANTGAPVAATAAVDEASSSNHHARHHRIRRSPSPWPTKNLKFGLPLNSRRLQSIRSAINSTPQILIVDFEKTLKPKLHFFQELGFTGSHLGKFISTNSSLLTSSLENKLKPRIKILKKLLGSNAKNEDLVKVLCRSKMIADKYTDSRLLSNALYLQSCGVVGSQLSTLLKRQPQIFTLPESGLREIGNKVLEMGFSTRSRMLVHGIHTLSCLRKETLVRKFGVFGSFGFSEAECMDMFRRTPSLFRASEEKLRLGIVFFMDTLKYDKTLLIRKGSCLMLSMEGRVIPRYRVLQLLKVKRLLKKDPSFDNVVRLSEDEFLEKFISRFADDAFDLLVAYKGHLTDSP